MKDKRLKNNLVIEIYWNMTSVIEIFVYLDMKSAFLTTANMINDYKIITQVLKFTKIDINLFQMDIPFS